MRESSLESRACKVLKKYGCLTHKVNAQLDPGYPDRIVVHREFSFYIEFKTEVGVVSSLQRLAHAHIRSLGISVYIVRRIEQIPKILESHGIKTGQ